MTTTFIPLRLREVLPKDLLVDLKDRVGAEALRAHEMVRDHARLDKKRARELVGQARFRMMEKGFQEVCTEHGGSLLDGGVIPHTEFKIFQPFMRFEVSGRGVILGMAAMPEPRTVPAKNQSRLAGVALNYHLSPRLDFDKASPKVGDIFALFLTSRDREKAGEIEEIAVGVVDSKYEAFLFYEPLETFVAQYAPRTSEPKTAPTTPKPAPVSLKGNVARFVPPEERKKDHKEKKSNE